MARRALLIGVPGGGINTGLAAKRLTPVLQRLGFDRIEQRTGDRASRKGILDGLDRLIRASEPGDAVFVHYFGHGGRVRFEDLESDRVFGYVTVTKRVRGGGFEAVLDRELSDRFAELDARCGNVTVMFDCCHSGELVRSREPSSANVALSYNREEPAPDWAKQALAAAPTRDLAVDSHPQILRLCGASPKREAFAAVRGGRHIGRLTEAFIAAIEEAGDDAGQLTWATVGHRLREHVVIALGTEAQWVALAGPRSRRLFSTESVEIPGSVAFVPKPDSGQGWLRAGWHQGVAVGDRWTVLDPRVDPDGGPRALAELTVESVARNRCEVAVADVRGELRPGMPAVVTAVAQPMAVHTGEATRSPWLQETSMESAAAILLDAADRAGAGAGVGAGSGVGVDGGGTRVWFEGEDARERALELLEDRARVAALRRAWRDGSPSTCPVAWTWRVVGASDSLPESGACLDAGTRVEIELRVDDGPPFSWFVSVVLVDPTGRPWLLTTRMPEGIELGPGERERVGYRLGRRGAQGFALRWPEGLEGDVAPASVLILASRRPIELAHIVRPQPVHEDDALALQGLVGETMRDRKPEHTRGCAWGELAFHLRRPTPED